MSSPIRATNTVPTSMEGPPAVVSPKAVADTNGAATPVASTDGAKAATKHIDDRDKQSSGGHGIGLFDLPVKPEFILQGRAECLGPIPFVPDGEGRRDDRDNNDSRSKKKKRKGRNKKRPRDAREDASQKVCMAVLRGDTCPFGDSCRFSHDLKGYMATRPTDIKELAEAMGGKCPIFAAKGYCFYGAICRVGSCHITKTGENVRNEEIAQKYKQLQRELYGTRGLLEDELTINSGNLLSRDVVFQLRKKTYPFQCKRYFENETAKSKTKTATVIDPPNENKGKKDINSPTIHISDSAPTPAANTASSSPTPLDKLKTKKIVDFSNKIYVAPLTTVGNLPFRRIMKQFGADITCGEMAVATNLLEGKPSEWALLKRHPSEDIFGIQLAAAHPDQFTRVSELVEKYADADFVDMNLGCPLDLLCNKGAGAGLMMREKKLKGALEGMSKNLSCSITVKMRTGWNMNKPFAHELVRKIQSWETNGLTAIMVRELETKQTKAGINLFATDETDYHFCSSTNSNYYSTCLILSLWYRSTEGLASNDTSSMQIGTISARLPTANLQTSRLSRSLETETSFRSQNTRKRFWHTITYRRQQCSVGEPLSSHGCRPKSRRNATGTYPPRNVWTFSRTL